MTRNDWCAFRDTVLGSSKVNVKHKTRCESHPHNGVRRGIVVTPTIGFHDLFHGFGHRFCALTISKDLPPVPPRDHDMCQLHFLQM